MSVEPGWVSTDYGVKTPAPVVVATTARVTDADVVTLLAPRRDHTSPRLLSVDPTSGTMVVELPTGGSDRVVWRPQHVDRLQVDLAQRGDRTAPGRPREAR